jgi:hypothetical protein
MRVSHLLDAGALRIATPIFVGAFAADLVSKRWAVAHANALIFNDTPSYLPLRMLMSRSRSASSSHGWRRCADSVGSGGVSIGCALLVTGILANGISPLLWARGVPDFIVVRGGWVWNLADFEIAIGLTGGLLSVILSAVVVYTRERIARQRS